MNAPEVDLELHHPSDIAALLDELVHGHAPVHAQAAAGQALSLPALNFDRTSQQLALRLPGLEAQAPLWLLEAPLQLNAVLGKVRIEFEHHQRRHVATHDGWPVLVLSAPERMRRLQRRQAFRVAPLSQHHPRAVVPMADRTQPLCMSTQDLSASGVALLWPLPDALPALHQRLDGVELELERGLRVDVSLQVQHTRLNARGEWVIGCGFVQLPAPSERQLLLHLNQLQRRHRVLGR